MKEWKIHNLRIYNISEIELNVFWRLEYLKLEPNIIKTVTNEAPYWHKLKNNQFIKQNRWKTNVVLQ